MVSLVFPQSAFSVRGKFRVVAIPEKEPRGLFVALHIVLITYGYPVHLDAGLA
jgi:hypothetical protein